MPTSPATIARDILRRALRGSLATSSGAEGGRPFVSLVTVGSDLTARPILLLSSLAEHTRNLKADPRAALLVEDVFGQASNEDPLTMPRVTLVGELQPDDDPWLRTRFLARHPYAFYADFADFRIWRFSLSGVHFVAGFGKAFRLTPTEFLWPTTAGFSACAAQLLADIAAGDPELPNRAAHRAGRSERGWKLESIDGEGVDFRHPEASFRIPFPVATAETLRSTTDPTAMTANLQKAIVEVSQ